MSLTPEEAGELLRARGVRSTPQRRAILCVFAGGRTEHLSADEIYERASRSIPELSRATVYATLAEFSELGLLSAFGSPDPVRYETHLELHAHFRCRLCQRVFDLTGGQQAPSDITDPGFSVERIETRAEGICDECTAYEAGLRAGARQITTSGPPTSALTALGAAVSQLDSPLGTLFLVATAHGLTRLAFEDHGDVADLRDHSARRRGSQGARRHLTEATKSLDKYLSGELSLPVCSIDWDQLGHTARALMTTAAIPYATHRSYSMLDQRLSPHDLGHVLGCNPIPVFMPCHRVRRGTETPPVFVGGADRRHWLDAHEQTHPLS